MPPSRSPLRVGVHYSLKDRSHVGLNKFQTIDESKVQEKSKEIYGPGFPKGKTKWNILTLKGLCYL